ncbi:MAG: hypothetical protein LBD23_10075 [Oscillospiraceae bacterium]|jgi:hypothetical protein|nr:hypothetical protein [Oscillospiraceae bacterium]
MKKKLKIYKRKTKDCDIQKRFRKYNRRLHALFIILGILGILVVIVLSHPVSTVDSNTTDVVLHTHTDFSYIMTNLSIVVFATLATGSFVFLVIDYVTCKYEPITEINNNLKELHTVFPLVLEAGLSNLHLTREDLDDAIRTHLTSTQKPMEIDIICCGGLKRFRRMSDDIDACMRKGFKFRILTANPRRKFLQQLRFDEDRDLPYKSGDKTKDKMNKNKSKLSPGKGMISLSDNIEELIYWATNHHRKEYVDIRFYQSLPSFQYLRMDNTIFVNNRLIASENSSERLSYEYKKTGSANDVFNNLTNYFDRLWEDDHYIEKLVSDKYDMFSVVDSINPRLLFDDDVINQCLQNACDNMISILRSHEIVNLCENSAGKDCLNQSVEKHIRDESIKAFLTVVDCPEPMSLNSEETESLASKITKRFYKNEKKWVTRRYNTNIATKCDAVRTVWRNPHHNAGYKYGGKGYPIIKKHPIGEVILNDYENFGFNAINSDKNKHNESRDAHDDTIFRFYIKKGDYKDPTDMEDNWDPCAIMSVPIFGRHPKTVYYKENDEKDGKNKNKRKESEVNSKETFVLAILSFEFHEDLKNCLPHIQKCICSNNKSEHGCDVKKDERHIVLLIEGAKRCKMVLVKYLELAAID